MKKVKHLITHLKDVPEGHYADENMKDTVVPNRNKIFSSIIQAVALSIASKPITDDCSIGQEVVIAMGIHAGDHSIYPDCRQDFRDADFDAFIIGNWGAENVSMFTPYIDGNKFDILKDGKKCCKQLGLDFDEVYKRTNTSYKPIYHELAYENGAGEIIDCSQWFSDYKSASSVERIEAFIKLDYPDPVFYADETGPVSWEVAKNHVEQLLTNHK
jgi:7-cyano-7-deazaguanine synthase